MRIDYSGAVYHITGRGNARQGIYIDDGDREAFLNTLAQVVEQFGWLCHVYCLMANHYPLLVETPAPNLYPACASSTGSTPRRSTAVTTEWGTCFKKGS